MPIQPLERRIILGASDREFESQAVLNPAVHYENGLVHMFYRAVKPGNYSSIGYAILKNDDVIYRSPEPVLAPEMAPEKHGLEDPRLIKLGSTYYLFYTVYDGADAQVAYATATELPFFSKRRIISAPLTHGEIRDKLCRLGNGGFLCHPPYSDQPAERLLWDKDAYMFPEYIHGKIVFVHRIQPEIQLVFLNSFDQLTRQYWLRYLEEPESRTLLPRVYPFESAYVGGGTPPIRTEAGWLFMYHGVESVDGQKIYRAGVALLDINKPQNVIARLPYPLFEPVEWWEKEGDVNNVVFPTGAFVRNDRLEVYYGAADKRIARVSFDLPSLLVELRAHSIT